MYIRTNILVARPLMYFVSCYITVEKKELNKTFVQRALSMLGKKKSAANILKYFSYIFIKKIGFCISQEIVSLRDYLHEMSKPVFWKNKKKYHQFVVCSPKKG